MRSLRWWCASDSTLTYRHSLVMSAVCWCSAWHRSEGSRVRLVALNHASSEPQERRTEALVAGWGVQMHEVCTTHDMGAVQAEPAMLLGSRAGWVCSENGWKLPWHRMSGGRAVKVTGGVIRRGCA